MTSVVERDDVWIVHAHDVIDARLAGYAGTTYSSPPQSHAAALALVALLVGPTSSVDSRTNWTVPVAGGSRVVALEPAP